MGRAKSTVAGASASPGSPAEVLANSRSGLRVRPLRPARALIGALVVVAAVAVAVAMYARIGDRTRVLVLADTVLAGEQLSDADLRVVSISSDDELTWVPASQRSAVVGMYARTRLVAGSLLTDELLQARPLVETGRVLMSVAVPVSRVPVGLRERSRVALVITPGDIYDAGDSFGPVLVEAVVAAVPRNLAEMIGADAGAQAMVSLSVEVDDSFVGLVGSAAAVGVGVLNPLAADEAGDEAATDDPVVAATAAATSTTLAGPSTTAGAATATTVVAVAPSTSVSVVAGSSGVGG